MADLYAELRRHIYCHIEIWFRYGILNGNGSILLGQRQRHKQTRKELRRHRSIHLYLASLDWSTNLHRQTTSAITHIDTELTQRLNHHVHRAVEQCSSALYGYRHIAERGDRGKHSGSQARLSDIQNIALRGKAAKHSDGALIQSLDLCAESLDYTNCR